MPRLVSVNSNAEREFRKLARAFGTLKREWDELAGELRHQPTFPEDDRQLPPRLH